MKILFEDEHYIVVSKPAHLFVHPYKQESNIKECLMKEVRDYVGSYVYPVNRLDRPVSGIVVFAKYPEAVKQIQEIWGSEKVRKYYLALTRGIFKEDGKFDFALNDHNKNPKPSLTFYRPLISYNTSTLVEVEIKTGRYHQIRRHFSRRVDHLLGDRKYGKKKYNDRYLELYKLERIFLHAHKLEFEHPYTKDLIKVSDPLAEDLYQTLSLLASEYIETLAPIDYIGLNYG